MNKKISAALFCHQDNIDVPVDHAWVLQKIDGNECYIDKVLKRLKSFACFENIYLLVGTDETYSCYRRFGSKNVKVVHLEDSRSLKDKRKSERNWNIPVDCGLRTINSWLYQVMLAFNEEFMFFGLIYETFISLNQIEKAIEQLKKGKIWVVFYESFCHNSGVVSKAYMERVFPDGPYVQNNKDESFNVLQNLNIISYLSDDGQTEVVISPQSSPPPVLNIGLNKKQGFRFMKKFYEKTNLKSELNFSSEFRHFFSQNKQYFDGLPDVIRINTSSEKNKWLDIDLIDKALSDAEDIGRLTVIIEKVMEHPQKSEIFSLLKKKNLHYILETDGQYDYTENQQIAEIFDIVKFLYVDEIDLAALQKLHPEIDAEKLWKNLSIIMNISHHNLKPQVGIECTLGEYDDRNIEIIAYWKQKTSPLSIGFSERGDCQLKTFPQIQFINYISAKVPERTMEFIKPELKVGE
jgi:hypothetical protein